MSGDSSKDSRSVVWQGKPWIVPGLAVRSIFVAVLAVAVSWLEFALGVAYYGIAGLTLLLWTILAFFVVWVLTMLGLLRLKASITYVLRTDSLEIRAGIVTSRAYVIAPTGFSDLEVIRTLTGKILNMGDIIIRTQSERDSERRMVRVRDPLKVADLVRKVMTGPMFRTGGPPEPAPPPAKP